MDHAAELRYYEILFTKTIHQFYQHYKLDKLTTFMEMAAFISEANSLHIAQAMQKVLTNEATAMIHRDEYLACLKLYSGLSDSQIRETAKCSPNTLQRVMTDYKNGDLHITNRFDILQSHEIRKVVSSLRAIGQIY